jgi:hypothetical protein
MGSESWRWSLVLAAAGVSGVKAHLLIADVFYFEVAEVGEISTSSAPWTSSPRNSSRETSSTAFFLFFLVYLQFGIGNFVFDVDVDVQKFLLSLFFG